MKPYKCKHCNTSFNRFLVCKRHEKIHTREKSLKRKQYGKCFQQERHLKEQTATHGGKKSRMLSSLTEVESLTCWICKEEFSREACIVQHYEDHMKKTTLS